MLVRVLFLPSGAVGIIPGREPLVAVWILARIDQDQGVFQCVAERGTVGSKELIEDLNSCLECGRFAPVNTIGEPDNNR